MPVRPTTWACTTWPSISTGPSQTSRAGTGEVPAGRTAVADYAAQLAETSDEARLDYAQLRLVHDLRAALTIGDADGILGKLACPACMAWSLVGTRTSTDDWAATCRVVRCAIAPGVPRVFTLAEVVQHHITHRDVAAA
ncbi:hypothetical protein ACFQ3Z_16465 [Streptomyces nogalater]